MEERIKLVEEILKKYMPREEGSQDFLFEAMNYSIFAGGKRIRPVIISIVYNMYEGFIYNEDEKIARYEIMEAFMAAIEQIHTYSLVHDDLPAMDNDMYRRGMLTTHAKYGEAQAILAGDSLLNYAFETIAGQIEESTKRLEEENPEAALKVYRDSIKALRILAEKSGSRGMAGGQAVDVKKSGVLSGEKELDFVYRLKTGALIEAAFMIGAVTAGVTNNDIEMLRAAAACLGMSFQIQDDILDVEGDESVTGKPLHSDEKNEKTTYVTLFGVQSSKFMADEYSKECIQLLKELKVYDEAQKESLIELVISLMDRKK